MSVKHTYTTSDYIEWNTMLNLVRRLYKDGDYRMSLLIGCGAFFGLRISDLLSLSWDMLFEQTLFVGDVLATGFWAARISEIKPDDTVLIIGAGPTGICTLLCVMLKQPKHIIMCEKSPERAHFLRKHYPLVEVVAPEDCIATVRQKCERGGADVVLEVAGAEDTFRLAWECARPNAIVTVVALYDKPQMLPLPEMYGKNLTFKTGGVDGCDCAEILSLIEAGKIDTTPLITHRYKLADIAEAYHLFENKLDGVIKVAVEP